MFYCVIGINSKVIYVRVKRKVKGTSISACSVEVYIITLWLQNESVKIMKTYQSTDELTIKQLRGIVF